MSGTVNNCGQKVTEDKVMEKKNMKVEKNVTEGIKKNKYRRK